LAVFGHGIISSLNFLDLMFGPLIATLILAAVHSLIGDIGFFDILYI